MIEITTYYSKKYDAQKRLMQIVAVFGFCLIICTFIKYSPLTYLVAVVGGVILLLRIFNMTMRTNYDYDEINWFYPTSLSGNDDDKKIGLRGSGIGTICAGASCCSEGTVWDKQSGCIPKS